MPDNVLQFSDGYTYDLNPRISSSLMGEVESVITAESKTFETLLSNFRQNISDLQRITVNADSSTKPYWLNGFFPGLDVIALHSIIAEYKPKLYLEIGSGNSTKVARNAIESNSLSTLIYSIDPFPRAEIDGICDRVFRNKLEDADLALLDSLEPNDILFFDGSHRLFPNSDVWVFFFEVLPMLKPGVIVHVHDIFLPYDYPQEFCHRAYNEQYMLALLMLDEARWQTLFPCAYISTKYSTEIDEFFRPLWIDPRMEKYGCSFWFKKGTNGWRNAGNLLGKKLKRWMRSRQQVQSS